MNQPIGYGSPMPFDWQAMLERFRQLEHQLQQTSNQLESMRQEVAELKNKSPVHVEYHFDQLKVSRLEGTLHIGVTPQGLQSMEGVELPSAGVWSSSGPAEDAERRIRGLQAEAAADVDRRLPDAVRKLAGQWQVPIDAAHMRAIVDDIKRQLDQRVHYYAKTIPFPELGTEEEQSYWSRAVLERTRRDVETAITQYLRNLFQPDDEGRKDPG